MKTGLKLNQGGTLINNLWCYYLLGNCHSSSDFLLFIKEYFKNDGVDDVYNSVNSDFIIVFDSEENKTLFILKYL